MEGLTETQINELLRLYRAGSDEAGEQLLVQLRPLVRAMVRRFASTHHDPEDLEQVGYIGLWKAIERYDFSAGAKLTTFAVKWITGEIRTYLRRGHDLLKKPHPGVADNPSGPSNLSEAAQRAGVSPEEAAAATEYKSCLLFPGEEKLDYLAPVQSGDEDMVSRVWLKEGLQVLEPRERKVIFYRYFEEKTQQQVAIATGLTQKQVSRLEHKVLCKMREFMQ